MKGAVGSSSSHKILNMLVKTSLDLWWFSVLKQQTCWFRALFRMPVSLLRNDHATCAQSLRTAHVALARPGPSWVASESRKQLVHCQPKSSCQSCAGSSWASLCWKNRSVLWNAMHVSHANKPRLRIPVARVVASPQMGIIC